MQQLERGIQYLFTNDYCLLSKWQKVILAVAVEVYGFSEESQGKCKGEQAREIALPGKNA